MPQSQAFAAAGGAALGVAWLIALQLTLSYRTSEELGLVASAIAVDLALAVGVFALVLRKYGDERSMALAALVLAAATLLFSGWPLWMDAVDARSTNPYPSAHRDAQIGLEFMLPSLVGLVTLWRMLVRAHRIATGLDPRTRWPWFTNAWPGARVQSVGIELVGSAVAPSGSDWLAGLWRIVVAVRRRCSPCLPSSKRVARASFTFTGSGGGLSGRYIFRRHHHRLRSGRLRHRDPRRAARLQDRDRREVLSRRHLPELGLHPDQGAAALGRDLPLHAACQGLRPVGRQRLVRSESRGAALARRLQAAE